MHGLPVPGFQTLLLCLLLVPALLAHDVSLEIVTAKYFQLMTATILLALLAAVGAFAASYQEHTKHPVTGHHLIPPYNGKYNCISSSEFYSGRLLSPTFLGCDLKLQTFRFSMVSIKQGVPLVISSL